MILINIDAIKWCLAHRHLPGLLNISRCDRRHHHDARPDDPHPLAATAGEPGACGINDEAPPALALAIREIAEEEATQR
jgi:hypothetical protein